MELKTLVEIYNNGESGLSTGMGFNITLLKLLKEYPSCLNLLATTVNELNNLTQSEFFELLDEIK